MEIQMLEMVSEADQSVLQMTFFEGVGIGVSPGRTELFAVDSAPETFERVARILLKMFEVSICGQLVNICNIPIRLLQF